jgi:hypothetical protein
MTPLRATTTDRAVLRGICVVAKCHPQRFDRRRNDGRTAGGEPCAFPRRPGSQIISESIPLFFVARNRRGLWAAREANGRSGGLFLFKRSAIRFAAKSSAPAGCATMFLRERFELDVQNQGSSVAALLDKLLRSLASIIPDYPPAIPLAPRLFEGERL